MTYQQKDYFILAKDNEYYHVLALLKRLFDKAKNEGNYAVWGESLEKLIAELEENSGENISPWAFNMIITILLDYVPEELKNTDILGFKPHEASE